MSCIESHTNELDDRHILGAIRLSKLHCLNEARFSILISDLARGKGLGHEMLHRLLDIARQEKLACIEALITPNNEVMKHICGELGFRFVPVCEENLVKAEIDL